MRRFTFALTIALLASMLALPAVEAAAKPNPDPDATWANFRATVPSKYPVYRPTWLPAGFNQPPALTLVPELGVSYQHDNGSLLVFTFGPTISAPGPVATEPVLVHGISGTLAVRDLNRTPSIAVVWSEAGDTYEVRGARGWGKTVIGRDDLLRVVASLAPVGADGRVSAPVLPNTGAGGQEASAWPGVISGGLGLVALLGAMLLGALWRRGRVAVAIQRLVERRR